MKRFRPGTIYCLRVRSPGGWRTVRGYIGQTRYRDYRKRVDHHLYGHYYKGEWHPPKYWAHQVVDYYPLWQGQRWSNWGIDIREFLCIRVLLPIHNVLLNTGNPRRVIPPPVGMRVYPTPGQITAVERWPGKPRAPTIPIAPPTMAYQQPAPRLPQRVVPLREWITSLAAVGFVVLYWPGMPGADALAAGRDWVVANRDELIGGGVLLAVLLLVGPHLVEPRRRRSRSRRRRSRRR